MDTGSDLDDEDMGRQKKKLLKTLMSHHGKS
jgi:hypothetical protein